MRAMSFKSDQKIGNSGEEAQVAEGKMHLSKSVNNCSSSAVDVEKGEVYHTGAPVLGENVIAPKVAEDPEQSSHSKPLIVSEKIVVTLLVVCFVVVEAYFVGVSFRDWLNQQKHGNSTTVLLANYEFELVVPQSLQGYNFPADGSEQNEDMEDSEPYEDFEGGLNFRATKSPFDGLRRQLTLKRDKVLAENLILREETLNLEDTESGNSPNCWS
ncbi:hypothetical protein MPTK1_3g17940 [Marchantia polymorpha subsp. ruderalis]|uniref:Uncharacterized protein n=2 Tax=Marchantia polymorpha TaxID=3197 RepID=A0A176WLZ0_MARPO|nr:hypothetical protein AXG93_2852s1560 [Marchantia polymorpha subsp. ruderalis]PTQ40482.1 hypothetical protein MARPO_0039s0002 [Marchantia polymorpha]BBN06046.1 hypothetical protein Mp_3g17940 [Marchantia polymorpha subsp. ruderalis]|eukprot:PTQ40482.1 hypothetical protein MARPO_0039s0002 [Marchantia polymorpha]